MQRLNAKLTSHNHTRLLVKEISRHNNTTKSGGWAPGVVVKRCVLAAVGLTSRPWVQSPVEAGKGRVDRRRVWGARALPLSPLRDGRRENG